jgi:hypothetical protein
MKPLGHDSVIAILDGPAVFGRYPTLGKDDRNYLQKLWKTRLEGRNVNYPIDDFVNYVLSIYDQTTLWVKMDDVRTSVSRVQLIITPPDEIKDNWRIMDTVSLGGTRQNGTQLEPGKMQPLQHGDFIEVACKEDGSTAPFTGRFMFIPEKEMKYHALIVSNPEGDDETRTVRAHRFKRELERRHFTIRILSEKVAGVELENELMLNAGMCHRGTFFLFAYTGHVSESGELKLYDGPYPKDSFFERIRNMRSKNILAIDGCFSNQFQEGEIPPRTAIITSTSRFQKSNRGILTESLIRCLEGIRGTVKIDEEFRKRLEQEGFFYMMGQKPALHKPSSTIAVCTRMRSKNPLNDE